MSLWTRRKTSTRTPPARFVTKGSRRQLNAVSGRQGGGYEPGLGAEFVQRDSRRGLIIGALPTAGGVLQDPRVNFAHHLRRSLNQALGRTKTYPKPVVTIYDATGKAIATMDPVTKERTPL